MDLEILKTIEEACRQQAEWWDDYLERGKTAGNFDRYHALKKVREIIGERGVVITTPSAGGVSEDTEPLPASPMSPSDAERQAAEKWLAEWFYAVAQSDVRLDSIPVAKLRVLASQLAPHAADFAEHMARGQGWAVMFPLGASVSPNDPMIALKLINARNKAYEIAGGPLPWAAACEAMEKEK